MPRRHDTAFEAGYDAKMNGANTENCHFSWFATKASTAEWEAGQREAERDMQEVSDE